MGRIVLLPIIFFCLSIQAQDQGYECPVIANTHQDFCDYVYDEAARKVIPATISNLVVESDRPVSWYSENGQLLPGDLQLVDGAIYFAGYEDGSCTNMPSVTARVDRQPVAGRTSQVWICSDSEPKHIYELMPLLSDGTNRAAEPGGTVSPALKSGSTLFDPSLEISGKSYKYTTPNSQYGICGPDDATIWIYILEAPSAGADARVELEENAASLDLTTLLSENATLGGEWSPELEGGIFDPQSSTPGIYTYTVTASGGGITCEDTAEIEVVVLATFTVCHKGKEMILNRDALAAHLKHGDIQGSCNSTKASKTIVSPNPSFGLFYFQNQTAEISEIRLLDFKGNLQKEFKAGLGNSLDRVDISDLKKGIYFAEIITLHGKQVERLIKK